MSSANKQTLLKTGLFNGLDDQALESLSQELELTVVPSGELIFHEGDQGDSLFLIQSGEVQIFTGLPDGREVVLARRTDYFGEQAILSANRRRMASVRASKDTALLRLRGVSFEKVLAAQNELRTQLLKTGERQLSEKLLLQSDLFRNAGIAGWDPSTCQSLTFQDQQALFREGDPGDHFYFIISGMAAVYKTEAGNQKLLVKLGAGQCCGELALLRQKPRAATVIAEGELKVLCVPGKTFVDLYERSSGIREYIQVLQRVYPLTGHGFVTQFAGKFLNYDALTTVYHQIEGGEVIASHVLGQNIYNIQRAHDPWKSPERVIFEEPAKGIRRELELSGKRLLGMTIQGFWSELGAVHQLVLQRSELTTERIEGFRKTGSLIPDPFPKFTDNAQIVCQCLQIPLGELKQAVKRGSGTAEQLAGATGASTVCGGCRGLLADIVGLGIWTPVSISQIIPVCDGIRTFRFMPCEGRFRPAKPGQHLLIEAQIDGKWFRRPYTISSAANEISYREITVKKDPNGFFSSWLFDKLHDNIPLRLSDPQGDFHADLDKPHPIICLVGGIGVTPALAICRSLMQSSAAQKLHIDYSVSDPSQFAGLKELQDASAQNPNITVNPRITREQGRFSEKDAARLKSEYPGAEFFICGPTAFQTSARQLLINAGVGTPLVHVEEFTPVGGKPKSVETPRWYFYAGTIFLGAFLIQAVAGWKIPFLERMQTMEIYKRWSGLALTLFIAAQWYLPVLRMTGRLRAAAAQYHWHKKTGCFAPLLYYFHSTGFGYGLLLLLGSTFLANTALGLFNHDLVKDQKRKEKFSFAWLIVHVALSVLTVGLTLYHIFIVFFYR